jgi:hypothetical protein
MAVADDTGAIFGFDQEEIDTSSPTRLARLKWVIVVESGLAGGLQANAVACVAAATQSRVTGLLGPDAVDADAAAHPGLPWAGCTLLGAPAERMDVLAAAARSSSEVFVADMPKAAQETRVYDEYLGAVERTTSAELRVLALSLVGPRKRVDKIIHGLSLLT